MYDRSQDMTLSEIDEAFDRAIKWQQERRG